jgi:endo-1,4-beta-xylanase
VSVTYIATGGTITSSGFYTAGTSAGIFRVIAAQQGGTLADTSMVSIALTGTLRSYAEARHFAMGSAVNEDGLANDPTYGPMLAAQYNSVVAEDAMKMYRTHPTQTTYNYAVGDYIRNFAQANGMAIHGHVLIYDFALPAWLTSGTWTKAQLLAIEKDYILNVVGHYAGQVATWDVANEVLSEDGSGFRGGIWHTVIGPEYIDSAFVWAHRADPAAKLYLNDWAESGAKANSFFNLVQGLRSRGIPIDGAGFESHYNVASGIPADYATVLARFANAGFDVRVSELDVAMANTAPASDLTRQGLLYRTALDACLALPRCKSFTTWGFTDKYSWIPFYYPGMGRGLPFDTNYQHKPAYDSLLARLREP